MHDLIKLKKSSLICKIWFFESKMYQAIILSFTFLWGNTHLKNNQNRLILSSAILTKAITMTCI